MPVSKSITRNITQTGVLTLQRQCNNRIFLLRHIKRHCAKSFNNVSSSRKTGGRAKQKEVGFPSSPHTHVTVLQLYLLWLCLYIFFFLKETFKQTLKRSSELIYLHTPHSSHILLKHLIHFFFFITFPLRLFWLQDEFSQNNKGLTNKRTAQSIHVNLAKPGSSLEFSM